MNDDKCNFEEHLTEKVNLQMFHKMQNDKKRYLIEDIASKNIDQRTLEEKKFLTWHLKFNMKYFKRYTNEHLSILTDKFECHLAGKLKMNVHHYAYFPIYQNTSPDIIIPELIPDFDYEQGNIL